MHFEFIRLLARCFQTRLVQDPYMQTSGRSPPSPRQTVGIWSGFGARRAGWAAVRCTGRASRVVSAKRSRSRTRHPLRSTVGPRPRLSVCASVCRTGCCVTERGTARMREDFVGAVGLDKIGRFRLDPRDTRSDADDYELVGDDSGVFGCMSLLAVTTSVRRTCHRRHRLFVFAGRWLWKGWK